MLRSALRRRAQVGALAVAFVCTTSACSSSSRLESRSAVPFWTTPDGSELGFDVGPAAHSQGTSPIVVLLHGYTGESRAAMSAWSDALRAEGVDVLNADWSPPGAGLPTPTVEGALTTPAAIACAIDHARALAGDSEPVVVVGVSAGAYQAVLSAVAWEDFDRSQCSAPAGPPPEVVVALAGAFDAAQRGPVASSLRESDVLERVDPFTYLDGPASSRIVVVHGSDDPLIPPAVAERFATVAEAELHVINGGRHFEFGSPTTPEGAAALALVVAATRSAG